MCDRDAKRSAPVRAIRGRRDLRGADAVSGAECACIHRPFVRSIKRAYLNRVILFGERQLRWTMAEYVEHYHRERNHHGLVKALIDGALQTAGVTRIRRRPRLGGC